MATDPTSAISELTIFPLLPLRDVVVFPHMVIPLFVGRPKSIKALDVAMEAGKHILLVAQKSAAKDEPAADDLYDIGSVATVLQMLKLPDGTVKVLVEGTQRARIVRVTDPGEYLSAEATLLTGVENGTHEIEAMRRALLGQFDQYVKLNKKIPPEILTSMSGIDDGGRLADAIAAHLPLSSSKSRKSSKCRTSASGSSTCSACSRARSTFFRSRSASAAASSGRWKRASASTT
jgi:ATP-dependent Lon protease